MVQGAGEAVPALRIRCGNTPYTLVPADAPILIGRESPAQIRVDDPQISRVHARLAVNGGHWVLTDAGSTNGMFLDGVIEQQALAELEAGRGWPSDEARTRLEEHLKWPPGTIAAVRDGNPVPEDESTEILSDTVQLAVMVDAADLALGNVKARIDRSPPPGDPAYEEYVVALLFDLRGLETMARNASKTTRRPDAAVLLRDIRRTYNNLMVRAAQAPGAPLSRRLYAARHSAELTVEETADAAGVSAEAVTDAESGHPVDAAAAAALEALLRRLDAD
jgi:hypothetical protein